MVDVDYSSLEADSGIVIIIITLHLYVCLWITRLYLTILQVSAIQRLDSNHWEHALQIWTAYSCSTQHSVFQMICARLVQSGYSLHTTHMSGLLWQSLATCLTPFLNPLTCVVLNWTELMVYFKLAVKRPNSIKIHDNTVTTKDMHIQSKVFTKFHVRAIDTIAGCHSIVLLIVLESKINKRLVWHSICCLLSVC